MAGRVQYGQPAQGALGQVGSDAPTKSLLTAVVCTFFLFAGCSLHEWAGNGFKVGPNYQQPVAPVASEWIDYQDPRVRQEEQRLCEWWQVFNDPHLNSLVDAAYQQNLSLRVAGARILEARALRNIAAGNIFPQLQQAAGSVTRNKRSTNTSLGRPPEVYFPNWETGFNLSWELDFWGRFRRAVEAGDAELDASVENYDDVLVILLADVAANYTQLRIFQQRLHVAWQNVVSQYNTYQQTTTKYIGGAAKERDAHATKLDLEQTRSLIPQLETGIRQANNQLCVLLGFPPRELSELGVGAYEQQLMPLKEEIHTRVSRIETIVAQSRKATDQELKRLAQQMPERLDESKIPQPPQCIPLAPSHVVVGVPAELLLRRPDVRRAERQLAAQSALIGIAESDFYPRIAVNGTLGVEARDIKDLFQLPESMVGSVGPSFHWAILNYGRILNNVRVQDARFQQLAFAYQDTVLRAGREAEDAMVAFLKSQEQTDRVAASVQAARQTVQIVRVQFDVGEVDSTPVFLFQSVLATQSDQLAVSQGSIALHLISLYRALGGGWEMRLAREGVHGVEPTSDAPVQVNEHGEAPPHGPNAVFPALIPPPEAGIPTNLHAPCEDHGAR